MKRKVLTRRSIMDVAFSWRTWRTIIRKDSSASRYVRLFLRAKARDPFSRADLTFVPRRTVDRHVARWRERHLLERAGRVRQKLPFNSRARKVAKARIRVDRRGQRRGRPVELYRIGDPLARRPGFHQAQLQASVALMRDPAGPEMLAAPMKLGLQLLGDPEGRKFFEQWLVPLYPEQIRQALRDLLEFFEDADPALLATLQRRVEADVVAVSHEVFPSLATALEAIAKQDGGSTAASLAGPLQPPESEPAAGDPGRGERRKWVHAREDGHLDGKQKEPG